MMVRLLGRRVARATPSIGGGQAKPHVGGLLAMLCAVLPLSIILAIPSALGVEKTPKPTKTPTKIPASIVKNFLATVYPEMWREATRTSVSTDDWLKHPAWRSNFHTVRVEKAKRPMAAGIFGGISTSTTPCLEPEEFAQMFPEPPSQSSDTPVFVNGCEIPLRMSPDVLWEGLFNISPYNLERISFQGTLSRVRSRNLAIKQQVDAHPEWSEAQMSNALKQAGASYGPSEKDTFLSQLQIQRYAPFIYKTKLRSVEFVFRHRPSTPQDTHLAMLFWGVTTRGPIKGNQRLECRINFEPFEGTLVGLGCGESIVTADSTE